MKPGEANPFLDFSAPLTPWRGFLLLLAMPLVIARLLIILYLVVMYIIFLVLMQKEVDPTDPLRPKFRNYPVIVRATKAMNHACLWLFGFKLVVRGQEHAQAAYARKLCPVVVCNHISFLDIWLIGAVIGPYFPVARGDMKDWPIFGHVLGLWGFAGVENFGSSPDATQPKPKAARGEGLTSRLLARVKVAGQWTLHPPVLVFPEGTCTSGRALLRFKTGAFVLGTPVLPVAVTYDAGDSCCCGWVYSLPVQSAIWRSVPRTLVQLFRVVATPGKRLVVDILPVYIPSDAELADPAVYAANVRGQMAGKLGLPDCDLAVEDARRFYAACEEGVKERAAAGGKKGAAEDKKRA